MVQLSGYQVDPRQLERLASDFAEAGRDLESRIGGFSSRAGDVGAAFGLLGPSDEVYHAYQDAVRDAVGIQRELVEMCESFGAALASNAANYRGASSSSVQGP